MIQRRHARVGLLTAALLAVAPASADAACAGADVHPGAGTQASVRHAVRCLVNQQRKRHGLNRLTVHRLLRAPAQRLARQMVAQRFFAHVGPDGKSVLARLRDSGYVSGEVKRYAAGEVIGYGSRADATPRLIVKRWLRSPGHRRILLDRRFVQLGVGVAEGSPFGHRHARTFTVDFGARVMRGAR